MALEAQLEGLGIANKVRLQILDTLGTPARRYGAGGDALIQVATDTAQDEVFTLHHEAVHYLRDAGLFSASEWSISTAKTKRDPGLMGSIRRRYGRLTEEAQTEEATADMFARYQRGDYQAKGMVACVFKRLADFLEALRNVLAGRGFRTAEGVMRSLSDGRVGGA